MRSGNGNAKRYKVTRTMIQYVYADSEEDALHQGLDMFDEEWFGHKTEVEYADKS